MPEAATGGFLWKSVFFQILQNIQETPAPEETPVNFTKFFKKTFLTDQLLLKCRHCKSKAREIDRFCCREEDAMFIASAKIPASCYPA